MLPYTIITRRKDNPEDLKKRKSIEWFRPPGFEGEDGYGEYEGRFQSKITLKLLNLGNVNTRMRLVQSKVLSWNDLDPDYQYSGSEANYIVHKKLMDAPQLCNYHGTFIDDKYTDDEDLLGPSEIVLFSNRVPTLELDHVVNV